MSRRIQIPDELIRIKAKEFWNKRQFEGRKGTPEDSRIDAKQYLEKHRWEVFQWKLCRTLSKRPIRRVAIWWETTSVEKFLEDIEFLLQKSAFLTILGSLSNLAVIVAVVAFVFGENVRRNNEVFSAWQTITSAEGQSASGGRIEALEFLNSRPWRFPWIVWTETWIGLTEKEWHSHSYWDKDEQKNKKKCKKKRLLGRRWERQSLSRFSAPKGAYLSEIQLCAADLIGANLSDVILSDANLSGANLSDADLIGADLRDANLIGANLSFANLSDVDLRDANLRGADLRAANLRGADLSFANLSDVDLRGADLIGADLRLARLRHANLRQANLSDTRDLTPEQVKSACYWA